MTEVLGWETKDKAIEVLNYSLNLFRTNFGLK